MPYRRWSGQIVGVIRLRFGYSLNCRKKIVNISQWTI